MCLVLVEDIRSRVLYLSREGAGFGEKEINEAVLFASPFQKLSHYYSSIFLKPRCQLRSIHLRTVFVFLVFGDCDSFERYLVLVVNAILISLRLVASITRLAPQSSSIEHPKRHSIFESSAIAITI